MSFKKIINSFNDILSIIKLNFYQYLKNIGQLRDCLAQLRLILVDFHFHQYITVLHFDKSKSNNNSMNLF